MKIGEGEKLDSWDVLRDKRRVIFLKLLLRNFKEKVKLVREGC